MKEVLLICAGGMSSSLMAKKVTEYLHDNKFDINVTARGVSGGEKLIKQAAYDFFLISPQIKFHFKKFEELAQRSNSRVAQVPNDAYAPVPKGIEKMANIIIDEFRKE